jgi:hypothetical protein
VAPQMKGRRACTLGKRTTADLWSVRANARRNSHCAPYTLSSGGPEWMAQSAVVRDCRTPETGRRRAKRLALRITSRGHRPALRHARLAEAVLPKELVTCRRRSHPEQSRREAGADVGGPVDSEVEPGDPDGEGEGR